MLNYQKSLDKVAVLCTCDLPDEDKEHVLTVIDALKKRIPKSVCTDSEYGYTKCPTCESPYMDGTVCCGFCGQALKWD